MTVRRGLLAAVLVLAGLLLQTAVLSALPLPGAVPPLLLVVVVALALADGPASGLVTGFLAGLSADLVSDHALGRLALVHAVVGYGAGLLADRTERSALLPVGVVAAASVGAVVLFAVEGFLLGDPRVTAGALMRSGASSLAYAVVLTPFVVPAVAALARRAAPDDDRRASGTRR